MSDPQLALTDHPDAARFEAHLGDELAGVVEYRRFHGRIALIHTRVMAGFEGRGVGAALARSALDAARAEGIGVTPICPFIAAYLERHPEDRDLVTWGRRAGT